ncbi:hypothetical protein ACHAQJ_002031 [Trichoderma viride]
MPSAQPSKEQPRRRGRRPGPAPVSQDKSTPNDESLEKRRQRNRKAQRLFRLRRQAAHANYEKNLVHIEGALEQMAATFLDFSNGILQSPLIGRDPALVSKLQSATNSILHLCQGGNDLGDIPEKMQRITSSSPAEGQPPGGSTSDEAEFQRTYHGNEVLPQAATLDNIPVEFNASSETTPVPQHATLPAPQTVRFNPFIKPSIRNAFGNGFMNLPPIDFADCSRSDFLSQVYPSEESLSITIARASMQHAYDALLGDTYASSALVDRIFGFTLKFRSREEILMVMRWYLSPQTSEVVRLATADFDDYLVAQYYHGVTTAQYSSIEGVFRGNILDPSNEKKSFSSDQSRILNAYQIEQWLLACGMRCIGLDTIELQDVKPLGMVLHSRPPESPEAFLQPLASLQQQHMPLQNASVMDGQGAVKNHTNPGSIFKNIRVSRSRLIHVLTGISFCIDKGPAYCEKALLEALVIAMITEN